MTREMKVFSAIGHDFSRWRKSALVDEVLGDEDRRVIKR